MTTCAMALARAMSEPTRRATCSFAQRALAVRRGSTTTRWAPFRCPLSMCWNMIGCVSRAFEPQSTRTSVCSSSS